MLNEPGADWEYQQGLTFVTFDETSEVLDGATSRIFVGTADNITASVYVSNDAGATWSPVAGQPAKFFPHKARLQPAEKVIYFTYSDGTGPYDGTLGGVYKYDLTSGTWTDITPTSGTDLFYGFGGLSVDMKKPGTLVVATLNSWYPDAILFRSTDSGATWKRIWNYGADGKVAPQYTISSENVSKLLERMMMMMELVVKNRRSQGKRRPPGLRPTSSTSTPRSSAG